MMLSGLDISGVLVLGAAGFVLLAGVALYRVAIGPTMPDRVIALNVVGTHTIVVIALLAAAVDQPGFLDIALVYALLNFLVSIAISKFVVERGGVI